MLLTTLSMLFFTLASIYFIHRIHTANNNICHHVENHWPNHWQDFAQQGQRIGNKEQWSKHMALASVKTGELAQVSDNYLSQQKQQLRRNGSFLSLSVLLGFSATELAIFIL